MSRVWLARLLRRWAQKLAPVPTPERIAELRDYYDNHCTVTGKPLNPFHITVNGDVGTAARDAALHQAQFRNYGGIR